MTTRVTVDAHAGWPVLVRLHRGERGCGLQAEEVCVVHPGELKDFYIHSGLRITHIEEVN